MPDATSNLPLLRRLWPLLLVLLAIYALWLVLAWTVQRRILFPRHVLSEGTGPPLGSLGIEQHWLDTDEGRVEGWCVPAPGEAPAGGAPTVFYTHGNAERIDDQDSVWRGYRALGFNVVLCEYRGYGRSAGSPTEAALTSDLVAVHDEATARPDVDADRLLYHGRSVGTGVACDLARERPPRALILTAPFTSVASLMARFGIPRPVVRDPFDNLAALRASPRPTLLIHGSRDTVIPAAHSRELAEQLPDARRIVYEGFGHNDLPVGGPRYWADIERFLVEIDLLAVPGADSGD